jgi:hypothetical protein
MYDGRQGNAYLGRKLSHRRFRAFQCVQGFPVCTLWFRKSTDAFSSSPQRLQYFGRLLRNFLLSNIVPPRRYAVSQRLTASIADNSGTMVSPYCPVVACDRRRMVHHRTTVFGKCHAIHIATFSLDRRQRDACVDVDNPPLHYPHNLGHSNPVPLCALFR